MTEWMWQWTSATFLPFFERVQPAAWARVLACCLTWANLWTHSDGWNAEAWRHWPQLSQILVQEVSLFLVGFQLLPGFLESTEVSEPHTAVSPQPKPSGSHRRRWNRRVFAGDWMFGLVVHECEAHGGAEPSWGRGLDSRGRQECYTRAN